MNPIVPIIPEILGRVVLDSACVIMMTGEVDVASSGIVSASFVFTKTLGLTEILIEFATANSCSGEFLNVVLT